MKKIIGIRETGLFSSNSCVIPLRVLYTPRLILLVTASKMSCRHKVDVIAMFPNRLHTRTTSIPFSECEQGKLIRGGALFQAVTALLLWLAKKHDAMEIRILWEVVAGRSMLPPLLSFSRQLLHNCPTLHSPLVVFLVCEIGLRHYERLCYNGIQKCSL